MDDFFTIPALLIIGLYVAYFATSVLWVSSWFVRNWGRYERKSDFIRALQRRVLMTAASAVLLLVITAFFVRENQGGVVVFILFYCLVIGSLPLFFRRDYRHLRRLEDERLNKNKGTPGQA